MSAIGDEVTPRLRPAPMTSVKGRPVNTITALGQWLARNGVTVSELAHVLDVSDRTLSNYLAGRRSPSADLAVEIAAHTGLTADQIVGRDGRVGRGGAGDAVGPASMLDSSMIDKAALVAMIGRRRSAARTNA